jgi:peptidoglycan hydrolase CwlO-like protein
MLRISELDPRYRNKVYLRQIQVQKNWQEIESLQKRIKNLEEEIPSLLKQIQIIINENRSILYRNFDRVREDLRGRKGLPAITPDDWRAYVI